MQLTTSKVIAFERDYPGVVTAGRLVRADLSEITGQCPVADDLLLLASELAANAVLHTRSGSPGAEFTLRAAIYPGDRIRVEVIDQGGSWTPEDCDDEDDECGRGLDIVAGVAGEGNWGVDGDDQSRTAWFQLDWFDHQG